MQALSSWTHSPLEKKDRLTDKTKSIIGQVRDRILTQTLQVGKASRSNISQIEDICKYPLCKQIKDIWNDGAETISDKEVTKSNRLVDNINNRPTDLSHWCDCRKGMWNN